MADAGPLMALAKVGGLQPLFQLFPRILTPPAVYEEVVIAGLRLGAPDAAALELHYQRGDFEVAAPTQPPSTLTGRLGRGEEECIRLACECHAEWLLIDDLDARQAALATFQATGSPTRVKGTLGIVLSAYQEGYLSKEQALSLVLALGQRLDVWISEELCRRVLALLEAIPE